MGELISKNPALAALVHNSPDSVSYIQQGLLTVPILQEVVHPKANHYIEVLSKYTQPMSQPARQIFGSTISHELSQTPISLDRFHNLLMFLYSQQSLSQMSFAQNPKWNLPETQTLSKMIYDLTQFGQYYFTNFDYYLKYLNILPTAAKYDGFSIMSHSIGAWGGNNGDVFGHKLIKDLNTKPQYLVAMVADGNSNFDHASKVVKKRLLRSEATSISERREVLYLLHNELKRENEKNLKRKAPEHTAAAACIWLNLSTGNLNWAVSGDANVIIIRDGQKLQVSRTDKHGFLGSKYKFKDVIAFYDNEKLILSPNDQVLLVTDGVFNKSESLFELKEILEVAQRYPAVAPIILTHGAQYLSSLAGESNDSTATLITYEPHLAETGLIPVR